MDNHLLSGAKGIDLGEVALLFLGSKLVFSPKNVPYHFTLHLGTNSGTFDIHKTVRTEGGVEEHTTLFTISHENLRMMLQEISTPLMTSLLGVLRPLRIGWLGRHHLAVLVGSLPSDQDLPLLMNRRSKKLLTVDEDKLARRLRMPAHLEDLYELQKGEMFSIYSLKRLGHPKMIGNGFKFEDLTGRPHLVWLKSSQIVEAAKSNTKLLQDAAAKYGVFHSPLPWW